MILKLPLSSNKHANAPTMANPDEVMGKFYNDLDDVITATPCTDKLILLGDFNDRPPDLRRSYRSRMCWEVLQQWSLAFKEVC